MLAANCQVPLTAVLLLFELTHDYFIIVRSCPEVKLKVAPNPDVWKGMAGLQGAVGHLDSEPGFCLHICFDYSIMMPLHGLLACRSKHIYIYICTHTHIYI